MGLAMPYPNPQLRLAAAGCSAAACLCLGLNLLGCGARPRAEEKPHTPASTVVEASPAPGLYNVTFRSNFFGPVHATMNMQRSPGRLTARTQEGIAWRMIGGFERLVGPIFLPSFFPRGSLLTWESALPDEASGTTGEGWIGIAPGGQYRATTRAGNLEGPIDVVFRDGRVICTMELTQNSPPPRVDYGALLDSVEVRTRELLFDAQLGDSPAMAKYFDEVRGLLPYVSDDVSFYFAAGIAWRRYTNLPLSLAYRPASPIDPIGGESGPSTARPLRLTWDEQERIATIEALVLDSAAAIERIVNEAISKNPRGIILDLRSCTGFDLSALRFASSMIDSPLDAGIYYSARWRQAVLNGTLDESTVATVRVSSCSDIEAAHQRLSETGVLRVIVEPAEPVYRGPVVLLTHTRTRSTGEILAAVLQDPARRPVIGERTAARARVSFEREVGQGFVVRVPEFDWSRAPATAFRGLRPDTRAGREESLKAAARFINAHQAGTPAGVAALVQGDGHQR